jgi:hypothetical protein
VLLVSQKEEALNRLDDMRLLELARSVSKDHVDSGTSRNNLIKIVKASLSIEEIKQKINQIGNPPSTSTVRDKAFTIGGIAQVFFVIYAVVFYIASFVSASPYYGYSVESIRANAILGIGETVFFLVSTILNMGSMIALRERFSGNRVGMISGSTGLVTSVLGMLYYLATILGLTYEIIGPVSGYQQVSYNLLGNLLLFAYLMLVSLTVALMGVFFLLYRRRLPDGDVSLAAGIVYIFAVLAVPYLFISIGYYPAYFTSPILLIMAGALGTVCFLARTSLE